MPVRDSQSYGYARYIFIVSGYGGVSFRHTVEARHASQAIAAAQALFGDRQEVSEMPKFHLSTFPHAILEKYRRCR